MATAHALAADDEFDEDELEPDEPKAKSSPFRSSRAPSGKGHFMSSIVAKLKKMPPAYWVLGLGGAALVADYFMEGDRSVASSLYRGIFSHASWGGGQGYGEEGADDGGGGGYNPALSSGSPEGGMYDPSMISSALPMGFDEPMYYPAYPYRASPGSYRGYYRGPSRGGAHSFGQGRGHGHAAEHSLPSAHHATHATPGMSHAHVRGGYGWE